MPPQADGGIEELCKDLVAAVAADDPVQYAQCWTTRHQIITNIKKVFPKITDQDLARTIKKMHGPNNAVRHSFRIIRGEIGDPAAMVKLTAAVVKKKKTVKFRNLEVEAASDIICSFKVGKNEWVLKLDDAMKIGDHWYFSDDAIELETHQKRIWLRMRKGKFGHVIEVKK